MEFKTIIRVQMGRCSRLFSTKRLLETEKGMVEKKAMTLITKNCSYHP
jgi:hypothetical protein